MSQEDTLGTPLDYTDTVYRVSLELGEHEDVGRGVIERFLAVRGRDVPALARGADAVSRVPYGYALDLPMQLIPELVRALAQANVAVYQVVRLGLAGTASPGPRQGEAA
ncbi:MAG: hypothetical protein ABW178_13090 [Pseudoxanthomonas sp.]